MTPTSTATAPLFDAEQLYNILMGAIEPELCTDFLPILDDLYLDETEEQHLTRMERYAAAIEQFKQRASEFSRDFKSAIWQMGEAAMKLAKENQQMEDASYMQATEDFIEQS